jgi:hypothetical protein
LKTFLNIAQDDYQNLLRHLFPNDSDTEQAAFAYARFRRLVDAVHFDVIELRALLPQDFTIQTAWHIEIADSVRPEVLKRAHDLDACLIEIHSHRGSSPAELSHSDLTGLRETVPYVWWRLKGKPYAALVFTNTDFDALVWVIDAGTPVPLTALTVSNLLLRPTGLSMDGWG